MGNGNIAIRATTIDHSPAIARLLALATGDDQRLQQVIQRYRDDPAAALLVAVAEHDTVGVIGYAVGASAVSSYCDCPTCPEYRRGHSIGRRHAPSSPRRATDCR